MRQRKLNRLKGYDYSNNGYYYITSCTKDRIEYFGVVENGKMVLNEYGEIVNQYWHSIPAHYNGVELDVFVIMPNHLHGIIIISRPFIHRSEIVAGTKRLSPVSTVGTILPVVGTEQCSVPTDNDTGNDTGNDTNNTMNPGDKKKYAYGLLSKIIKSFKEQVIKTIHKNHNDFQFQWQRSFHDHIIRDEKSLFRIRRYIQMNPKNWKNDELRLIKSEFNNA